MNLLDWRSSDDRGWGPDAPPSPYDLLVICNLIHDNCTIPACDPRRRILGGRVVSDAIG